MTEQNYELQWTTNQIIEDLEKIGKRIEDLEFTLSQREDIQDALDLIGGSL